MDYKSFKCAAWELFWSVGITIFYWACLAPSMWKKYDGIFIALAIIVGLFWFTVTLHKAYGLYLAWRLYKGEVVAKYEYLHAKLIKLIIRLFGLLGVAIINVVVLWLFVPLVHTLESNIAVDLLVFTGIVILFLNYHVIFKIILRK